MASVRAAWKDKIAPAELVRAIMRLSEVSFIREYGAVPYLAIRVSGDAAVIAGGLESSLSGVETQFARPIGAMGFHTDIASRSEISAFHVGTRSNRNDEQALARAFSQAPHYVIPLKKRQNVDAAFMDRISVGRAPNKDIMLRHASISKFHAWFQFDELSACSVADAGSKNGTRISGARLAPREPVRIESGDLVTFGSIEAIFCDAEAIWRAFHRD